MSYDWDSASPKILKEKKIVLTTLTLRAGKLKSAEIKAMFHDSCPNTYIK